MSIASIGLERALRVLGFETVRIAGEGAVDRLIKGLSPADAPAGPDPAELAAALADLDVAVVENLFTLPLHLPASRALASALRGRRTIVRHFDPPWQRERFRHIRELPVQGENWVHVCATRRTQQEIAVRGIESLLLYPMLAMPQTADRREARLRLGVPDSALLCLHPVRAIERKNVPAALALANRLGGHYWLTGPAEEDYRAELDNLLSRSDGPVLVRPFDDIGLDAAYAAADLVLFPSVVEGFGLPPVEAALRRRPAVVGRYQVAMDLRRIGFDWPSTTDPDVWRRLLANSVAMTEMVDRNERVAVERFGELVTFSQLRTVLARASVAVPRTRGR